MTEPDVDFKKIQLKRDIALLLQGFGWLGILGSTALLMLSFSKGQGFYGWFMHQGLSGLPFCVLSIVFGVFLARQARAQLRR